MSTVQQLIDRPQTVPAVKVINKSGTYMADVDGIPWTPFVFPKTFFKLLHLNEDRGTVTLLLLAEKGAPTPIHKHIGAAEIYVLRGSFTYEEGAAGPNYYVHEAGGVVHVAEANDEILAFVVFHGPLVGYNEDGSVSGVCDCDLFYELAERNGAVGHLPQRG
jgi:quercetin dioxygenase-like cupin family protein